MKKTALITFLFPLFFDFYGLSQSNFPSSWLGIYEGKMKIQNIKGIIDTVDVEFHFLPTDKKNHWTYRMVYNSEKWGKMAKNYELFWSDTLKSPNIFILDEKDGILIKEIFVNDKFYSHFVVNGAHFHSILGQKNKKTLYFEISSTDLKNGITTVSKPENDVTYEVKSYFLFNLQSVELKRIKKSKMYK